MKTSTAHSKTTWIIDSAHSEIQFKIRHLMISTVTGQFNRFDGTVETDGDDFTTATVHVTADVNSINTHNEQRDAHLQSGDFFDTENHPKLIFEGDKLEKISADNYKVYGTLTMRGVSKRIVLDAELGGIAPDPWGNTRAGFSLSGKINRKDFGVSFGAITETGGALLGDEVKISVNVQFVKQAALQAA